MNTDDLAQFIIYMSALIVWELSNHDSELYEKIKEQGMMKWEAMKEEAGETVSDLWYNKTS